MVSKLSVMDIAGDVPQGGTTPVIAPFQPLSVTKTIKPHRAGERVRCGVPDIEGQTLPSGRDQEYIRRVSSMALRYNV